MDVQSTYKSHDTEEWLDRVFTRPLGYLWACFFRRLGVHPNVVTVLSMLIGASSCLFFAHGSWRTEGRTGLIFNVIGVLLLTWANLYDSADGQLARMTGQKTRLGRMLDGAASEVWFIPIYLALVWRFGQTHPLGLTLVLLAAVLWSGFHCHAGQCALADYYRQIHLLVVNGRSGSELDTSGEQQRQYEETPWRGNVAWKLFLKTYVNYTRSQERRTPEFQQLRRHVRETYGQIDAVPTSLRQEFRAGSLPLMPLTNVLTFNTRALVLYACCLLDVPWLYFAVEIILFSALCEWMRRRHERLCFTFSRR